MYDDFDDSRTRRLPPTWQLAVLAIGAAVLLIGAAAALVNHNRVARSKRLAVKYGLATSTKDVSLVARCSAAFRDEYETSSSPPTAVLPKNALVVLAPKVCAAGAQRGFVREDGTMTRENAESVTIATVEKLGRARVQTLIYTGLAVSPYHLAKPGHVTRWDRCVAMGYSGYDAQTAASKSTLPPRADFFRAVRVACTNGIARGLVPASGAPSPRDTGLLLREALATSSK